MNATTGKDREEQIHLYLELQKEAQWPSTLPDRRDELKGMMAKIAMRILNTDDPLGIHERMAAEVIKALSKLPPPKAAANGH